MWFQVKGCDPDVDCYEYTEDDFILHTSPWADGEPSQLGEVCTQVSCNSDTFKMFIIKEGKTQLYSYTVTRLMIYIYIPCILCVCVCSHFPQPPKLPASWHFVSMPTLAVCPKLRIFADSLIVRTSEDISTESSFIKKVFKIREIFGACRTSR